MPLTRGSRRPQVEAAIEQDPSNREWTKLRADLLEVIQLTSELAQVTHPLAHPVPRSRVRSRGRLCEDVVVCAGASLQVKASTAPAVKDEELKSYVVGEKCQAIYEQDGQWYNAKIVALSEDGYFVTFLSYGNTAQVEFNEVRPYQRPDTNSWTRGSECSAIYAADSRWCDVSRTAARASPVRRGAWWCWAAPSAPRRVALAASPPRAGRAGTTR